MTGYTRQSTYSDGDTILAADSNNEFDAIEITMAAGTGHAHDNNSGQGAYVPLISNVANSRKVEVTASGALTTGDHQVTGQIISDAGPITATLGNIVAAAGSVDATLGAVTAGTTVTGGTGVIATTGNVTATAGSVDATVGAVSAGTTVTAGTGITATTGDVAVSSGNITVSGTVDGRDVATDGTKLDGIESGAKDDQTAAEVVSTPAGNLIATDVQAALNELDTEKAALAGAAFTGAITTTSTFDGRDVATDGTKLDGIETAATADQTKADIDALLIDAATLDTLDSTQFLRSDTSDTLTGSLTVTNDITLTDDLILNTNHLSSIFGKEVGGTLRQIARMDSGDNVELGSTVNPLQIFASTNPTINTGSGFKDIWHEGNSAAASAWVNFNGTGTVTIRDDLNVSSITDNGTGSYQVNFTTTMANNQYTTNVTANNTTGAMGAYTGTYTTTDVDVLSVDLSPIGSADASIMSVVVHGGI